MDHRRKQKLQSRLNANLDEQGKLVPQIGMMSRTPRYAAEYSAAKLDRWQRELADLQKDERAIRGELEALITSDDYRKAVEAETARVRAQHDKLRAQESELKARYNELRPHIGRLIVDGGDPLVLAAQLTDLENELALVQRALEGTSAALAFLAHEFHLPPVQECAPWIVSLPHVEPDHSR